jgi:replicative DNA helicase
LNLYNEEAERAVIGSVLIDPVSYYEVAQHIKADDFYIVRHQWIWQAISQLHDDKSAIDIITLRKKLELDNKLEETGGVSYLMDISNDTPSSMHAESYARLIKETSTRNQLIKTCSEIAKQAYDENISISDVMSTSISGILNIASSSVEGKIKSARDVFAEVYDMVSEMSSRDENDMPGVATGFTDLDRILGGGLQNSRLYTLGGRPGNGKTSLLMSTLYNIAYNAASRNKTSLVFSLEMDSLELGQRLMSIDSGIDGQIIQSGKLIDNQWTVFTNSFDKLSHGNIFIDDSSCMTPSQMRAKCKHVEAEHGLDLIILDYLGLMNSDRKYTSRVDEVSEISRSLKRLARDTKKPVFVAHQLNREVEKRAEKKPQLSDMRDSGSVEQDSDCVLLIHPDEDNDALVHLNVAKQRNGPTGIADLVFLKSNTKFVSRAY